MNRRAFIRGAVLTGVTVGMLDQLTFAKATRGSDGAGEEIHINLKDHPDLKEVGGAYKVHADALDKDLLLAHVSEGKFEAVDIRCTHKGCDVEYQPEEHIFQCPCHGSQYELGGEVKRGPAKQNLTHYRTELHGEEVIIYFASEPVKRSEPEQTPAAPAQKP